jgi:hypothetical protein
MSLNSLDIQIYNNNNIGKGLYLIMFVCCYLKKHLSLLIYIYSIVLILYLEEHNNILHFPQLFTLNFLSIETNEQNDLVFKPIYAVIFAEHSQSKIKKS